MHPHTRTAHSHWFPKECSAYHRERAVYMRGFARCRHNRELLEVLGRMMDKELLVLISESLPQIVCHMYLSKQFKLQKETLVFLREIFGQNHVTKLLSKKFPDVM